MVVFLLLGGVIADRVDRRVVIQVCNVGLRAVAGRRRLAGHHRTGRAVAPDRPGGGQRHLVRRLHPRDAGDDPPAGASRPAPAGQRAAVDGPRHARGARPDHRGPARGRGRPGLGTRGRCRHVAGRRRPAPPRAPAGPGPQPSPPAWCGSSARGGRCSADDLALDRGPRLRRPQRDPRRRLVHPRPHRRPRHHRRRRLGVRRVRRVGRHAADDAGAAPGVVCATRCGPGCSAAWSSRCRCCCSGSTRTSCRWCGAMLRHRRGDGGVRTRLEPRHAGERPRGACCRAPTPTTRSARSSRSRSASWSTARSASGSARRRCSSPARSPTRQSCLLMLSSRCGAQPRAPAGRRGHPHRDASVVITVSRRLVAGPSTFSTTALSRVASW